MVSDALESLLLPLLFFFCDFAVLCSACICSCWASLSIYMAVIVLCDHWRKYLNTRSICLGNLVRSARLGIENSRVEIGLKGHGDLVLIPKP